MSTSQVWDRDTLPEATYVTDDGRVALLPKGAGHTAEPTARLSAEVALWSRPSASFSFPYHPLAVAELVRRADERLEQTGAMIGLTEDELGFLGRRLWSCARVLYTPGQPVRSALDAFGASARNYLPEMSAYRGDERAKLKGIAVLAAWAVVQAACEWVGEVS